MMRKSQHCFKVNKESGTTTDKKDSNRSPLAFGSSDLKKRGKMNPPKP